MATNKDSILVTNRDGPAQNKHRNKFVSKLVCALLNRRTHQGTEILTEDFVLVNRNTVCLRRLGNGGFVVPCCLHSWDQAEYLVLRNNSFSAPHCCADREGQGVSCEGGVISGEES